jgi:MscS family membrane protein
VDEVNHLLLSHPKLFHGEQRVRFAAFGESALQVEVWCWVATRDFLEYTGVVEELNFAIARIVERAGTFFALPSRTVYMAKDGVVDTERAREIEQEVARRREHGASGDAATQPGKPGR